MDEAKRAEMIKRMQQILYRDVPYIVTAYSSVGEAGAVTVHWLRTATHPGGVYLLQYGPHNYINMSPCRGRIG
jgi:ABC-type transport system substrate-binding protein